MNNDQITNSMGSTLGMLDSISDQLTAMDEADHAKFVETLPKPMTGLNRFWAQWRTKAGVCKDGLSDKFGQDCWCEAALYIIAVLKAVPVVTAAVDQTGHSEHSLHKKGLAVDVRISDWYKSNIGIVEASQAIAAILGNEWCVVLERDHLHCQWSLENVVGNTMTVGAKSGNWIRKVYQ